MYGSRVNTREPYIIQREGDGVQTQLAPSFTLLKEDLPHLKVQQKGKELPRSSPGLFEYCNVYKCITHVNEQMFFSLLLVSSTCLYKSQSRALSFFSLNTLIVRATISSFIYKHPPKVYARQIVEKHNDPCFLQTFKW